MTLFPRTLLWRSVLLIALLLVIANLAWLQIFRVSEREPRARQVAQQIVSVVNLTRAALITASGASVSRPCPTSRSCGWWKTRSGGSSARIHGSPRAATASAARG
jgi:hypothetical protein